ncbi:putative Ig domain-containing protein, partial [Streptomyces sp. NPDC059627]
SRNLPLTGTLNVPGTVNGAVAAATASTTTATSARPLAVPNPYGMSSPVGKAVNWRFDPTATGITYTGVGLPPGITLDPAGVFTGSATRAGSYTVTVTAKNATGSTGSATFVWTATRAHSR